jgi:hypothetical protein
MTLTVSLLWLKEYTCGAVGLTYIPWISITLLPVLKEHMLRRKYYGQLFYGASLGALLGCTDCFRFETKRRRNFRAFSHQLKIVQKQCKTKMKEM